MQNNKSKTALFLPVVIIALVSFAVYFNALSNDFVYDDKAQVVENRWIRDIRHIPEIFSKSVWGFEKEVERVQGTANYYRPAMHVVYMASYYLFGLKPWGFHLVNVLFHMGVSVLVFFITARLLGGESSRGGVTPPLHDSRFTIHDSRFPPFIAALLFATHPIHTEAVTWVASLPEVAFAFFYLLSFFFYVRWQPLRYSVIPARRESFLKKDSGQGRNDKNGQDTGQAGRTDEGTIWYYLFSLASFSISLFFKEPALTLPVILIAYDLALRKYRENSPSPQSPPLKGGAKEGGMPPPKGGETKGKSLLKGGELKKFPLPWGERVRVRGYIGRFIPYFIISVIYLLLRVNALRGLAPSAMYGELSSFQLTINIFPLFFEYLKDLIFPFDLNFWHEFRPIRTLFTADGLLSVLIALAYAAAVFVSWKRNRIIFLALLLILLPLLPAFYIKGIGAKPYAERYLYLPSAGFVVLIAAFLLWLRQKTPRYGGAAVLAALLLAGAYSAQTITRNPAWKDDLTFLADTLKKAPEAEPVRVSYGIELADQGRLDEAIEQFRIAVSQFQSAVGMAPESWFAYANLGIAYGKKGELDKAIEHLELALKLQPNSALILSNLGNAYRLKGSIDKAVEQFQAAVKLNPDLFEPHFNLGNAYEQKGLIDKAVGEYEAALRLRPDHEETHYLLGRAYANSGRLDDAIEQFSTLAELRPDNASYRNTLGVLYGQKGLLDRAVGEFEAAVRLAPDRPSYRQNLEKAMGLKEPAGKGRK